MRKTAIVLSLVLLFAILALVPLSFFFQAHDYHISLGKQFHGGLVVYRVYDLDRYINRRKFFIPDPSITFFSDAEYGPYEGSIMGLGPMDYTAFGQTWGIYYRYFPDPSGWPFWTLTFSLWYPIFAFSLLSLVIAFPQIFRSYSLRNLLFFVTVVGVVLAAVKVSEVEHPVTVAFTMGLCAIVRTIYAHVLSTNHTRIQSSSLDKPYR